ncbi:MAG: DoxX family membrane protein [Desulfuromonadales bacterium]|nr:DoxX family membrane protein [Desulfuromonadales bacterium]MBN2791348.1 DoxX family membrane protein [Desulfuromonadales bacterium]
MTIIGKVTYHTSRLVLAGVFIYAGVIKANDIQGFAGQVANYQLLPYAWNYLVAATLPYLELLCGILLLLNMRVRPALLVLFVLNLVFILVLFSASIRGFDIDCGCFKPDAEQPTEPLTALWRDLGLAVLMIVTWLLRRLQVPKEND